MGWSMDPGPCFVYVHQNFTKNLDRLGSDTSTVENTKLTRSPRKPSASNDPGKMPTECIFSEKQTTRKSHGKKEQCVTFAVFKDNRGATLEHLPPSVKIAPNISSFRRKLKTLIFTGCQCKSCP